METASLQNKKWRWEELVPVGFILAVFIVSAFAQVTTFSKIPLCLVHALCGVDCPGCGLTRAFISLFHGEFRRAIAYNALAPVILLFMLLYLYRVLMKFLARPVDFRSTPAGRKWIGASFLLLLFGQWGLKLTQQLGGRFF